MIFSLRFDFSEADDWQSAIFDIFSCYLKFLKFPPTTISRQPLLNPTFYFLFFCFSLGETKKKMNQ